MLMGCNQTNQTDRPSSAQQIHDSCLLARGFISKNDSNMQDEPSCRQFSDTLGLAPWPADVKMTPFAPMINIGSILPESQAA
jgi:hypothetical protein